MTEQAESASFSCDICKMTLNCYQQYMQHKTGKKHLSKAKQKGMTMAGDKAPVDPSVYGGKFVAASLSEVEGHMNGNQPKDLGDGEVANSGPQTAVPFSEGFNSDTLAQIEGQGNGSVTGSQDPVGEAVRQNLLGTLPKKRKVPVIGQCEPCGVIFNSTDQEDAHMSGKRHAKKMKLSGGATVVNPAAFYCSFCDLQLNSIEQIDQHRAGSKHMRKVGTAKDDQDETRLAKKLPKLNSADDLFAPPPPPPPPPQGGIPLPPAALESLKYTK